VIWCVLVEAEVRAGSMVVIDVHLEHASKMRLVQDDHVIATLSSDRPDYAFHVRVVPRTRRRGDDLRDAHPGHPALEQVVVDAVAIAV
jgi:hypothetical protein